MIYVPAGEFLMGSDAGKPNEKPVHQVWVGAFYVDRYEVTNADYREFVLANPQWQKPAVTVERYLAQWDGNDFAADIGQYPVVYVTHESAEAYCKWREKRLPSEAEWEKAARGGKMGLLYPWGNQVDPKAANYDAKETRRGGVEGLRRYLKPVGSFPPNGYLLYDMGGNVAEWCADRYVPYYRREGAENLSVNARGPFVVRGGSWFDRVFDLRCAARQYALSEAYYHIGFRCVKSAD